VAECHIILVLAVSSVVILLTNCLIQHSEFQLRMTGYTKAQ
jgi:hypothetical protein